MGLYEPGLTEMYSEEDLLPISALQHLVFCARQCALIYIEQVWDENRFTAEGHILHERVHEPGKGSRGEVHIERGVWIRSFKLGLIGKADVVEFQSTGQGGWQPFPVEYKRGKPKPTECDKVQLCAQAICLEEMLEVKIPSGAIFYGRTRHRQQVDFDADLRETTEKAAKQLHELFSSGKTPRPAYTDQCKTCSLVNLCLPKAMERKQSVREYLSKVLQEK